MGRQRVGPTMLSMLTLSVAVLISFWPAAARAASVECPDWQTPSECSNSNKTGNNNSSSSSSSGSRDGNFMNGSMLPDNLLDMDLERDGGDNWPLERIVSIIVPVFFGIIGFAGLLGNALVILGKSLVQCSSVVVSFSLPPWLAYQIPCPFYERRPGRSSH